MARLHIDVSNLADEIEIALGVLARGGQVMLERGGQVVAELVPPGGASAATAPTAAGAQPAMPGPEMPDFRPAMTPFAAQPDGRDPFDAAMELIKAQGIQSMEMWDELNREEALLEYLASEMEQS